MKVLVTGGAGFIGSSLVRSLLQRGDAVRVLDNFSSGKHENLEEVRGQIEVVEGDIRDAALCAAASDGVEGILHHAAIGSVELSMKDPLLTHEVNVGGTLNLLLAARARGVRRFVFASSSAVYGEGPEEIKSESLPSRPLSPYAASKLAAESYTNVFARAYGLEALSLRYFNIFGPRQDPNSQYAAVVPRFAALLLESKRPTIYGDGEQTRDFTYVENVARINLLALECPPEATGASYNVGCGAATSVNELFRMLRERAAGKSARLKPIYESARAGDIKHSLASIELAQTVLGFVPTITVKDGIRLTVDWYRERQKAPVG